MKRTLIAIGMCLVVRASMAQTLYVNLENDAVMDYLDEVSYAYSTESQVAQYLQEGVRLDMPRPAELPIPETTAQKVTVTYSEMIDFSDCITQETPVSEGVVRIYNLIPDRVYFYKMEADDKVLMQGEIKTTGRVRMIYVPTAFNIRDMGGWETEDGNVIKYGKIYRGAELNGSIQTSEEDLATLRQLGIEAEIDLREASENDGVGISAFGFTADDNTYLFTNNSGCCDRSHLTGYSWTQRYRKEFEFIVRCLQEGRPVYQHCISGADRTGLLAFLLEGLLGVSYENMMKDYELTSFYKLRTKNNVDFAYEYINSLNGETLQDKFKYYFTNRLYVSQANINFFINEMLEPKVLVGITELNNPTPTSKPIYDLQGRRINKATKGIRVEAGKKSLPLAPSN